MTQSWAAWPRHRNRKKKTGKQRQQPKFLHPACVLVRCDHHNSSCHMGAFHWLAPVGHCLRRRCHEPRYPVAWWAWFTVLGLACSAFCAAVVFSAAMVRASVFLSSPDTAPAKDALMVMLSCAQPIFLRHNVTMFLAYGSLLGARREGDFIKGDVPLDIDIGVVSCDEARLRALAPEFKQKCDSVLIHRADPQYTSFGSWSISKTAFRLFWRRAVPLYLDFQMYSVFADRDEASAPASVVNAQHSVHGCGSLASHGPPVVEVPPLGATVPPAPRGLDWALDTPDLGYVTLVFFLGGGGEWRRELVLMRLCCCGALHDASCCSSCTAQVHEGRGRDQWSVRPAAPSVAGEGLQLHVSGGGGVHVPQRR